MEHHTLPTYFVARQVRRPSYAAGVYVVFTGDMSYVRHEEAANRMTNYRAQSLFRLVSLRGEDEVYRTESDGRLERVISARIKRYSRLSRFRQIPLPMRTLLAKLNLSSSDYQAWLNYE